MKSYMLTLSKMFPAPWASVFMLAALTSACEEVDRTVPSASAVEEVFQYDGVLSASINGNVAEVTITQPERQIRRGGTLWAKVGPYVLLFSEEAESLFRDYPGLAGIRVVTTVPGGIEVARAPKTCFTARVSMRSFSSVEVPCTLM